MPSHGETDGHGHQGEHQDTFCVLLLHIFLSALPVRVLRALCIYHLRECDIDKIVETYERREDVDKYAHVATMQEIEENGFNLNIPRYVDTFEPEEEIDLNEVAAEIRKLQSEIKEIDAELKPFFDELGLDFPFEVEGK